MTQIIISIDNNTTYCGSCEYYKLYFCALFTEHLTDHMPGEAARRCQQCFDAEQIAENSEEKCCDNCRHDCELHCSDRCLSCIRCCAYCEENWEKKE